MACSTPCRAIQFKLDLADLDLCWTGRGFRCVCESQHKCVLYWRSHFQGRFLDFFLHFQQNIPRKTAIILQYVVHNVIAKLWDPARRTVPVVPAVRRNDSQISHKTITKQSQNNHKTIAKQSQNNHKTFAKQSQNSHNQHKSHHSACQRAVSRGSPGSGSRTHLFIMKRNITLMYIVLWNHHFVILCSIKPSF